MALSTLERDILRCCAGEPVRLPYDKAQDEAIGRLSRRGLIVFAMEDDQPTNLITDAGRAALSEKAREV